jgi:hypothetical protein
MESAFSSFMVHSTFTMMEKVVLSGLPAAICLLTMMFLFGTTPFGAYSTPNAKVKPILKKAVSSCDRDSIRKL